MTRRHHRTWKKGSAALALLCITLLALSALFAACVPVRPAPVVRPDTAHLEAIAATCRALWQDELGREIDAAALADCGLQIAEGRRTLEDYRAQLRASDEYAARQAQLEAARTPARRTGAVRLDGRTFADDGGPWLATGTSLFWAPWGYLHDRERLIANLDAAAGRFDYIRVLAVVGPRGGWEDRTITAADVLGTDVVAGLTDLAYARGLRVQWTIFGGIDSTPTPGDRRRLVEHLAQQLAPRLAAVQLVEVGNEAWNNGFDGESGLAELKALAAVVRAVLPGVPLALTAPDTVEVAGYYAGSQASIATVHTERDVRGAGGMFRPVRQAREFVGLAWINNEPIGPQSSVAADDDPDRLALAAAYTWLCNGAAYVYHTGAGIRGGGAADQARGRSVNLWEVPGFAAVADRLAGLRAILPADLPNWTWQNSNDRFPQYLFELPYETDGTRLLAPEDDVLRAFAAYAGDGRFVVMPIAVRVPLRLTARRPMTFAVHDIRDVRAAAATVTLAAGQSYTLAPTPGAVLVGSFQ